MPRAPKKDAKNQEPLNYNYHTLLQEAKREYRAGQPARELKARQAQIQADLAEQAAREARNAQARAERAAEWKELGMAGSPTLTNVSTYLLEMGLYVSVLCAISMCLVGLLTVRRLLLDYLDKPAGALGAPAPTGGGAARPALGRALDLLTEGLRALPCGALDLLTTGLKPLPCGVAPFLPPGIEPYVRTANAPDHVVVVWGPTW